MGDVLRSLSIDDEERADELVARARATGQPCRLTKGGKAIAILLPLAEGDEPDAWTEEEREAFLSLAGLLTEEQGEAALRYVHERREAARRVEQLGQ